MSLSELPAGRTIGVACGSGKVDAICAGLRGKLVSGVVTDELTARMVIERVG